MQKGQIQSKLNLAFCARSTLRMGNCYNLSSSDRYSTFAQDDHLILIASEFYQFLPVGFPRAGNQKRPAIIAFSNSMVFVPWDIDQPTSIPVERNNLLVYQDFFNIIALEQQTECTERVCMESILSTRGLMEME